MADYLPGFLTREDYCRALNDRAAVEQRLLDIANGKRELPSRDECRDMAIKLGIPKKFRGPNSKRPKAPRDPSHHIAND